MISLIATHAIPRLNRLILLVRLDPMTSLTSLGSPPLGFYPILMWIRHISYGCLHIHVDSPHLLWIPSVDYLPHLLSLDSLYAFPPMLNLNNRETRSGHHHNTTQPPPSPHSDDHPTTPWTSTTTTTGGSACSWGARGKEREERSRREKEKERHERRREKEKRSLTARFNREPEPGNFDLPDESTLKDNGPPENSSPIASNHLTTKQTATAAT
ncbi:hypothetical protein YC2023_025323 [Brassica napus]